MDRHLDAVSKKWGVHFMGVDAQLQRTEKERGGLLAMDAQPELVTLSNSGIPAFLSTYIDPKVIEILVAPMKATEIVGEETKKGDWTLETAMFPVVESTGMVSSYGDYSETGIAGANVNWVQRQSYTYQVITQWGERELDKMGLARIDWANRQRIASVLTLNKFQNRSYFFGIAGLANYGLLNDPSLSAPIAPLSYGGLVTWAQKMTDAANGVNYVYNDIIAMYRQLVAQADGLVELDMASPLTLAMSPSSQVYLTLTNPVFATNVKKMIETNFPKLKFEVAPEYSTASGELVQLIADEMAGQRTATTAFTEKLRAHPIIVASSSFKQKTSQGTWGTIIFRPFLIAQMLGV
jgi:hypothetical protein